MRKDARIMLVVFMLGWIGAVSMPISSLWSALSSVAQLSHSDQSRMCPTTIVADSSIFDKSTYVDHIEGNRVRGNVINRAINAIVYDPVPLEDNDFSEHFLSQNEVEAKQRERRRRTREGEYRSRASDGEDSGRFTDRGNFAYNSEDTSNGGSWNLLGLTHLIPKVNFRCDPLINFKLKQRLVVLGACVTLGLDYLSDIAQWRSYCAIEDNLVQGRFSLRGAELGWAKSWLLNLGLGEEQKAKIKLRLGLNLKNYKAYAKLRFRTEPLSPFDIGEGLSCAGKLPLPVPLLPLLRDIPLRIEYRLRLHTGSSGGIAVGPGGTGDSGEGNYRYGAADSDADGEYESYDGDVGSRERVRVRRRHDAERKVVQVSSGLGSLDLSLEQLNFCLEWDEKSPVWGVGLVRSMPLRKGLNSFESMRQRYASTSASASGSAGRTAVVAGATIGSSFGGGPAASRTGTGR